MVGSLVLDRFLIERELKVAGDAKARVQVLMAENSDLQKKLTAAENTVREISADRPRKAQELQDVRQQLEKLRSQLVASQKAVEFLNRP